MREVRAFVQTMVDGEMTDGEALPAFPPPDVPRKAAASPPRRGQPVNEL